MLLNFLEGGRTTCILKVARIAYQYISSSSNTKRMRGLHEIDMRRLSVGFIDVTILAAYLLKLSMCVAVLRKTMARVGPNLSIVS